MKPYDGCHITIEVPHGFEPEEKRLREYYAKDLPGIGVRVEYREDAMKPRPASVTIDPQAYVRTPKAAEEWENKSETSQLKEDPFPVVIEGVLQAFKRFVEQA